MWQCGFAGNVSSLFYLRRLIGTDCIDRRGTTHFCDACHKNAANLLTARKPDLPSCKCGFEHKPNGEEFAFCLLCRLAAKEEAAL